MRMRLLLVLATVAALLGAPSLASAAGNDLSNPSVSPTSGTVTTVFTLRVRYDGKIPASTVSVAVAGLSLPMARISGSLAEGTWAVSTLLPAGTWTPTFSSSAGRGNTGTVTGPVISVTGPVLPNVTPAPTGATGLPSRDSETDDGPGSAQDPGSVDPGTAPAEEDPAGEPSGDAEPIATSPDGPSPIASTGAGVGAPEPAGSSGSPRAPGSEDDGGDARDDPQAARGDAHDPDRSVAPGAMPDAMPAADHSEDDEPATDVVEDWSPTLILLLGLTGVAAVTGIGTALLILGRRRTAEEEVPIVVPERSATDALLEKRTLRRARVRLGDDPIVAAMGVDDQVEARRQRRRASQVTSGPGERPTRPRR